MGEARFEQKPLVKAVSEALSEQTSEFTANPAKRLFAAL